MRPSPAFALPLLALAAVGLWSAQASRPAADGASSPVTPRPIAARDQASTAWRMPALAVAPTPVARKVAPPSPAPLDPAPAPDWSHLALGVAPAAAATAPAIVLSPAEAPADLAIAISPRERRMLIASARDSEQSPAPEGYRPGIAVIVPGGSRTDGICR